MTMPTLKKILIGFAFFYVSFIVARIVDNKLKLSETVAGFLPASLK